MSLEKAYQQFKESYLAAVLKNGCPPSLAEKNIQTLYDFLIAESRSPTPFQPYHQRLVAPFNYYQFGLDFFRPLIQFEKSHVYGKENLHKILEQIGRKENAILLANHQTEPDPQIISLLLEKNSLNLQKN